MSSATSVRQKAMYVALAHRNNPAGIEAARSELAAERIALYAERIVAKAPPLTVEQRDRLAVVLAGGQP